MPKNQTLLAAFGEMALRHEHMNRVLQMTIKTLAGITVTEALAATNMRVLVSFEIESKNLLEKFSARARLY